MHKGSGVSVRGLSLRGSSFGPKARVRKKKPPQPTPAPPPVAVETVPFVPIATVDALVKELRKSLHGMFAMLDPNIPTTNLYDNCSQQAFRYFTTTNTITPEAFHHKINKLGLNASRKLCVELFRLVDQEDLGELTYATFAHCIFLPAGYFNFSKPPTPVEPPPPRPASARKDRPPTSESPSPRRISPTSPRERGNVPLMYETFSLSEIESCISRKLEARISRSTDRFRQAFRIFTKSEGITFAELHHHLSAMQIHLSHAKCLELFNRFDSNHSGSIELSEFTAALFRHEEDEENLLRPADAQASVRLEDFDVEAGATLTIQEILARLREKLEQHTSKETDRFRQAFRIFGKSSGILPHEFNVAMAKLGLKLNERQVHELFELFDFDKSGDLDLNEFVQGVMLDDSTRHWFSIKDRQKVEESRRMRYSMAVQSVQNSWTIADIERMLREKIEQRTSRSSDCFRQAYRIFGKVNGIKPDEFHAALEAIGLTLDRSQADILFQRFDQNGSGDIDLDEFIHGVLPPDYTGRQWVAAADELHREAAQKKKQDAMNHPDRYMTEIEMENWSLDDIERRIRDKIQQSTSKSSDTFRQAYKIFKKCSHVTIDDFRESLLALGFRLTPSQCAGLFRRYDTNNSNDLDLQEFCLRILPPDYTGDGDYWAHSDKYNKQRQQDKLEYVKRSKNGLLQLPKFDEARVRFTRGHYEQRDFSDLESDVGFEQDDQSDAPRVDLVRPASRPGTPTSPRTPRPATPSSPQRPMSPRVTKLATGRSCSNNTPPASPQRPLSPRPPSSKTPPTSPCASPSPRRPMTPRARPPSTIAQTEEEEDVFDDVDESYDDDAAEHLTSQSLRALRAKRIEAAARHRRSGGSVSGESTASFSSTVQRAVGGAKFTPTRNNALLLQRFLRAAAAKQHNANANSTGTKPTAKRPHTTRL